MYGEVPKGRITHGCEGTVNRSYVGDSGLQIILTGCGSVWLERLVWDQEAAGSNPVTPSYVLVAQLDRATAF